MRRNPVLLLRALSALLAYPDRELRAALPEIADVIRASRVIKTQHKNALLALIDDIASRDELDAQGRYVDLFDRGRRTSLNLFEHVHGDGRERGPAMLELRQRYLDAGMEPVGHELPDHLPLLLEYLSCRPFAETRDTLGEIAHILRQLGNTLLKRHSRYAAVMAALLTIGGEKGLDAHAAVPPTEDIDRDWEEKPAFAPPNPNPVATANPEKALVTPAKAGVQRLHAFASKDTRLTHRSCGSPFGPSASPMFATASCLRSLPSQE